MNKPVQTYRAGNISASIWENQVVNKDGTNGVYHTVSLSRSYQDKQGEWKSTTNMRVGDLPKAELVLRKAYELLVMKQHDNAMTKLLETGKIPAVV
ncbi:MAG: hypothetical protein ACE5FT_02405 [Candidatus Nanoarchaeia archaeon]